VLVEPTNPGQEVLLAFLEEQVELQALEAYPVVLEALQALKASLA
jgi:hypothetical protein